MPDREYITPDGTHVSEYGAQDPDSDSHQRLVEAAPKRIHAMQSETPGLGRRSEWFDASESPRRKYEVDYVRADLYDALLMVAMDVVELYGEAPELIDGRSGEFGPELCTVEQLLLDSARAAIAKAEDDA